MTLHQFPATSDALRRIAEADWEAAWDAEQIARIMRAEAQREVWAEQHRIRTAQPAPYADLRDGPPDQSVWSPSVWVWLLFGIAVVIGAVAGVIVVRWAMEALFQQGVWP